MSHSATPRAFTMIELMASMAVLAVLGLIVSQMVGGSLRVVGIAHGQMDSYRETRALCDALEGDLRRATARRQAGGDLNFQVTEDDDSVRLGLSVPDVRVRSVDDYGTVAQIVYLWDKKTKMLQRAEFHSLRDPDLVASTGTSADGSDAGSNETRRRLLAPAYASDSPYGWLDSPLVAAELKRAATTPLLEAVADLEIVCYADRALRQPGGRNVWQRPDRLPAAIRVRAKLATAPALARSADLPGLRSVDFYVPLPQFYDDEATP